jgi:predicted  nucleic acid-binding Zn-ribbon protein
MFQATGTFNAPIYKDEVLNFNLDLLKSWKSDIDKSEHVIEFLTEEVTNMNGSLELKNAEIEELKEEVQENKRLLREYMKNPYAATQRFLGANMD